MKIKTLIVDDEPLARERLRRLLDEESDIEVVGECGDGRAALMAVEKESPDLVFLDVQMPEVDGFGVVAGLKMGQLPAIIFVTAYDRYALKAFEFHALDYLLKPFDRERFQGALQRARAHFQRDKTDDLRQRLNDLLADLKPEPKSLDRLAIKTEGRVLFLKLDEIDWIEAADNYVIIHAGKESPMHRETMSALEAKLPPEKFMRISRSTIVNVERIRELHPMFHGEYSVILRTGTRLTLSRSYHEKVQKLLGKG